MLTIIGSALFALCAVFLWVYISLTGTPWGRLHAQKQLVASLKTEYPNIQFQASPASYEWKDDTYVIQVKFTKLPSYKYWFILRNGQASLFTSTPSLITIPNPDPNNPNWVNETK